MSEKKEKTFKELEDECEKILEKVADPNIPLDEAATLYKQGIAIVDELDEKLKKLLAEVEDEVRE